MARSDDSRKCKRLEDGETLSLFFSKRKAISNGLVTLFEHSGEVTGFDSKLLRGIVSHVGQFRKHLTYSSGSGTGKGEQNETNVARQTQDEVL